MLHKKNYIFQRGWDHIEWVVPSNQEMPLPLCSRFYKLTDVDHWVGHNSVEKILEVIDPHFFEENKDVFPAKTLEYFKTKENHSHHLHEATKKKLCRAADAAVPQGHVWHIKWKEEKDHNGATTYQYYGRTLVNTRCLLSQEWLDVNFKVRYPSFYGKLMNTSSASEKDVFQVPEGTSKVMSSGNIEKMMDAPHIHYQQGK